MSHAILQNAKASNKYIKDYDPSKQSSYLMSWDSKNLSEWAQKFSVDSFECRKDLLSFDEEFIQNSDGDGYKEYILEIDVDYPKKLQKRTKWFPILTWNNEDW